MKRKRLFFKNWYWISIISWPWSYTDKENQYEVAVLIWNKDERELCYSTEITSDVIWYCNDEKVKELKEKIKSV